MRSTNPWFLNLPHDIAGGIAMSCESQWTDFIGEHARDFILFLALILWLSWLDLIEPIQNALIFNSVFLFILTLFSANLFLSFAIQLARPPFKVALYCNYAKLTDRDILIASRRRICVEGNCEPEMATDYISAETKKNLKREIPLFVIAILIYIGLGLSIYGPEYFQIGETP